MIQAGVICHGTGYSLSPVIHGHWLARYGIAGRYDRIDVRPDELGLVLTPIRQGSIAGVNVTIPHKETVLGHLDILTDAAAGAGAANIVYRNNAGQLVGDNSDGAGFMAHYFDFASRLPQKILMLGAGGAARGILLALVGAATAQTEILIVNRDRARAERLIQDFATLARARGVMLSVMDWDARAAAAQGAGLLINATSLGMTGQPPLEMDLSALPSNAWVYDIVYKPLETPLLAQARARGLGVIDGLGMLLHQAVPAFEKFFGTRPTVDGAVRQAALDALAARR